MDIPKYPYGVAINSHQYNNSLSCGSCINIQYNTDTGNGNTKLNHKILCVICNEISLKTTNNKIYTLFNKGFSDNSICYLNNLEHLILDYFNP
jgi:hypothetical protein